MTYAEVNTLVNTIITEQGLDFIHSTDDQINTYEGDFPLVVLFPPTAQQTTQNHDLKTLFSFEYEISMAFMQMVSPDRTYAISRAAVEAQYLNAVTFAAKLMWNDYTNADNIEITRVRIEPFFQFPFSAHVTSGVMLSFNLQTIDTLSWCAI